MKKILDFKKLRAPYIYRPKSGLCLNLLPPPPKKKTGDKRHSIAVFWRRWRRSTVVERWSLTGELSLSCA